MQGLWLAPMSHIVVRAGEGFSGYRWVCEDCGAGGMHTGGGPHALQLRYAREKHRCRYVKSRDCLSPERPRSKDL